MQKGQAPASTKDPPQPATLIFPDRLQAQGSAGTVCHVQMWTPHVVPLRAPPARVCGPTLLHPPIESGKTHTQEVTEWGIQHPEEQQELPELPLHRLLTLLKVAVLWERGHMSSWLPEAFFSLRALCLQTISPIQPFFKGHLFSFPFFSR